ncbi:MAG: preprotein translocase subunit SecG [uncultured bacterium]|nr:MAG: preprotein translocase subunit SecG [uncultured bacterium]OFW69192.1 MAG: preprotein translocase subunit SecG [Alphaproteobacteria bacterium GWC2_42_16]OFW73877.1 MAG: preprotein translocase subunit SecG [Alphaproteobacteria bacterium GWA2_41_27]OFW82732.1 MAG: preprotein translocase subunit SecG [Alphaproteobacteria bacterium RIFCSPHIGHO2_12_FULL_42_100]OFW86529.1 MAG: preprotein translocase subunit SecG [Alphaproteobacteria bacterium RBG_16_42_14]OFW91886.1 MAG: preprotein translocas
MQTILLVIHLLITGAMIGVILVQRSEGGMGLGSGTMGGLMTTRGSANLLTHVTAILAICFLATSLGLAISASHQSRPSSILDRVPQSGTSSPPSQSGSPLKRATD